jgi:DNA-binding NtrC family response regulator
MNTRPIKVLLVDDEEAYVALLEERLTLRGLDVVCAFRGEAALNILKKEPVDVVVLDLSMPGLSGLETLAEIKRRHPGIEVILLTGHADIDASIKGVSLGAFEFLVKPVEIEELHYRIEDAFRLTNPKS